MIIEMNMTMKWVKIAMKIKWKLKWKWKLEWNVMIIKVVWNDDENWNCGGLGGFPPHGEKY